jgi:Carbohydrate-selective porin, OprB family/S-layer homology domain
MINKTLRNYLLAAPALIGVAMIGAPSAIASEAQTITETQATETAIVAPEASGVEASAIEPSVIEPSVVALEPVAPVEAAPAASDVTSINEVMQYNSTTSADMGQVTSISQLSDVRPTDWAFQALQSLVERYGCIAGYPDGTYRGRNFMTRYEFAAGLNACMDRVSELIAAGLADAATREDLATLQRLQEEFAAELATLRGRVDSLEARTAELEANQFSTTTKLNGEVIFALSGVADSDDLFDDQIIFSDRVRLNFDTSFTGEDQLRTRLQARNTPTFDADPVGFSFGGDNDNDFQLDNLYYTFPLGDRVSIFIGANGTDLDEMVTSTISPLDNSAIGSVSDFGFPRQYTIASGGGTAGAGAIVQLTDSLSLDFGYASGESSDPSSGAGLFDGNYGIIGQLTYLSDFVDAALTYVHAYNVDGFGFTGDDSVGNTYGTQVNFKLGGGFQLGGGIAYSDISGIGAAEDYDVWSWQGTLAIDDLGSEGSRLGILAGVPSYTLDLAGADDTSFLTELFYAYRLNDNISLTPSIIWINDPFNDNDIDDTFIGTLRTTFTF